MLLVLTAVLIYPLGFSFWVSLHDYRLTALNDVRFVGWDNYVGLLGDRSYWKALSNTLIFVFLAVGLELTIGFGLALLLHRPRWLQNVFRAVLLTPMFITPIAVGLMFRFLLNSQLGIIPYLLNKLGITVDWFGPQLALYSIIMIDVWQWTPFMLLLLLAGLESLPHEPFEAARVDGASSWFTFRKVTLPLMRPVILVAIIIRMLDAFKVFEYIYAITRGGPGERTETILYHIYRVGFRFFRMGEAAAMAYTLILVTMLLVVILFYNMQRGRQ
ncbi:MAG TPA: sugar ABC transporter permease [Anaerolineae bacterium]|nr:sugar ABC transporter permease [Anaerolineae bacterium]HIQ05479.1 sugar ABC transporter permease [Anaerolineae bacterium]